MHQAAGALERGDREELRRHVHSLKSNALTVGARPLHQLCLEVEAAAQEGAPKAIEVLLERTRSELERVLDATKLALDAMGVQGIEGA